jgi:hypothetical protein
MGYLNKSTVTVDAILTKKGRQLLATGRSAFNITKFAVSDDEVDYGLYDPSHPLGSEYYGFAIENMPIIEASPDETQNLRYKLVTFVQGTNQIPKITNIQTAGITLTYNSNATATQESFLLEPLTSDGSNSVAGYTVTLYDSSIADMTVTAGVTGTGTGVNFLGDLGNSINTTALVLSGLKFRIIPKNVSRIRSTQLVIVGNETGATLTIPVTINPA